MWEGPGYLDPLYNLYIYGYRLIAIATTIFLKEKKGMWEGPGPDRVIWTPYIIYIFIILIGKRKASSLCRYQ